jgi:hypothetical protein
LTLEPLESVVLVFQPETIDRPARIDASTKPIREPIVLMREPNGPIEPPLLSKHPFGALTLSPVGAAAPFRATVALPADVDLARCRVYLELDDLPNRSAAVTINGQRAGGMIGLPTRLEISRHLKPGENSVLIEPMAPRSARLAFFATGVGKMRDSGVGKSAASDDSLFAGAGGAAAIIGPRYYGSFATYHIPFRPIEPLTQAEAKSWEAYYVAYFNTDGKILSFAKYLDGKREFSDEYTYDSMGIPVKRRTTKWGGEVTEGPISPPKKTR